MAALNLKQTPLANLVSQIALDNPGDQTTTPPTPAFAATLDMLTVAPPTVLSVPDNLGNNTQIVVSTVAGKAQGGPWQFTYRRLTLSEVIKGYTPSPFSYLLQASELNTNQDQILDLAATLTNVLAAFFDEPDLAVASDFAWQMAEGQDSRPQSGYVQTVYIATQPNAIAISDVNRITVILHWPVRVTDKTMDDIAVSTLSGYAIPKTTGDIQTTTLSGFALS